MYGKQVKPQNLGIREGFSDIGQTVCKWLGVDASKFAGTACEL